MGSCCNNFFFFLFSFTLVFLLAVFPTSHSIPFVYFHGLGDACDKNTTDALMAYLNGKTGAKSQGQCIEMGGGINSLTKPMMEQIKTACEKVKELKHLKDGYNIFGISQGTLVARGVIQFCDDAPPVKTFVSFAGPQAGVAILPMCQENSERDMCSALQKIVYDANIQAMLAPATYFKAPMEIEKYLNKSLFLPKLNNERPGHRNATYKQRFSSLEKLVLVMSEDDKVVVPRESAWFGYYQDGSLDIILPANQTQLYKEDWIGLKALTKSKRVIKHIAPGGHANMTPDNLTKFVVPYLTE